MGKRMSDTLVMPVTGNRFKVLFLPQRGLYNFLAVSNPTPNSITIYAGVTTDKGENAKKVGVVPPNTAHTFPIDKGEGEFTFAWIDGGGNFIKEATYTFAEENPNINTLLGSATANTVTINGDAVGLARQNQLPPNLDEGSIRVSVNKVRGVNALKVTSADVSSQTIKTTAGSVYAIRALGTTVTVQDSNQAIWEVRDGEGDVFTRPLNCSTSIVLSFASAGSAVIQYE